MDPSLRSLFEARLDVIQTATATLQVAAAESRATVSSIRQETEQAFAALTAACLPELADSSDAGAEALGIELLRPARLRAEITARRAALEAALASLAPTPSETENVALAEIRLAELSPLADALEKSIHAIVTAPGFMAATTEGQPPVSPWSLTFFRRRRARYLVLETLGLPRDEGAFLDLVRRYRREDEALRSLKIEMVTLRSVVNRNQARAQERTRLRTLHDNVVDDVMRGAREIVETALAAFDDAAGQHLATRLPHAALPWWTLSGSRAKERYLVAAEAHFIAHRLVGLANTAHDTALILDGTVDVPFARAGDEEARNREILAEVNQRTTTFAALRQCLHHFRAYDRGATGQRWWEVITEGRFDGSFLDELLVQPVVPRVAIDPRAVWERQRQDAERTLKQALDRQRERDG